MSRNYKYVVIMTYNNLKRYFLLMLLMCAVLHVSAQIRHEGEFKPMRNAVNNGYNFWFYIPEEYADGSHPLPLVIFLHGASLCGNNLNRVRRYGVLDAIDKGKIIPTLVMAPQNSGGAWNPEKLNNLLEWAKENYAVDTTRVYVLGMSLGGYGTMDFCATYPEKIAAGMALCGGCSKKDVSGLGKLPMWIMHGTADRAVSVRESQKVVEQLQQDGNDALLRYDWLKGGNHGILARLFYLQKTYDWLFSHSLRDNPRTVDRHFDITKEDIDQTYQDLKLLPHMYDND